MTRAGLTLFAALCCTAAGCSTRYAFDLANHSGQTITIDIVDAVDGRPTPPRQAVLGPGGHYIEDIEFRTPGLTRSLRIAAPDDDSVEPLQIEIPPNRAVRHDVLVADGRITLRSRER